MERWFRSTLVIFCCLTVASGVVPCFAATAQQTTTPAQAQVTPQPADSVAKKRDEAKAKTVQKGSKIKLNAAVQDSVIQDRPAHRSKVCTVEQRPKKISCVFAVTHAVGDSCSCKVGDSVREGRFLEP